ncbi:MAG: ATP synthase F1 subunit gamma [Bacteroidetes bacterium]|uniref:ATP synthase gamma chain n=1 Tax=Candidatus Merdivivens pullistercoris TaxID=2840873 RepID=A0A9D9I5E7_9BACT|nr:ATP synthase F1 subunit gamma [Candidatus Merdivivens pullistercoris]
MASLKEIKSRINSINGTLKITSAMKMVASAKLHKVQNAITNMLPYERQLHEILSRLLSDSRETESATGCEEFIIQRPVQKVAIIAVSSNSSLCGAFNANAIRHFRETAAKYAENGLSKEDILVFPVGRKMAEAVIKDGFMPQGDYNSLAEKHIYKDVSGFADNLIKRYLDGEIDKIELVYNHYKSSASQIPVNETYLPFDITPDTGDNKNGSAGPGGRNAAEGYLKNYIVEPDPQSVLRLLLPKVLILKIYTMLLDANAAEHAARTIAMQEATDNAQQLLQELKLQYNKQRQQAITDELLDIVSGTMVNN